MKKGKTIAIIVAIVIIVCVSTIYVLDKTMKSGLEMEQSSDIEVKQSESSILSSSKPELRKHKRLDKENLNDWNNNI